jgi:hypothetical protein
MEGVFSESKLDHGCWTLGDKSFYDQKESENGFEIGTQLKIKMSSFLQRMKYINFD